jgi:hypothetical protein
MSFFPWSLARKCEPYRRTRRPAQRRRTSYRPQLESLEDRRLLSKTTIWTGQSNVDIKWSDAQNWSNGVPGAGDTAEFDSENQQTQYSTVDVPFMIGGLLMKPVAPNTRVGSITVNASLTLTGSSEWDYGTITVDANGSVTLTNTATMTLNEQQNTSTVDLGGAGTFQNNGIMTSVGDSPQVGGSSNNPADPQLRLDNASTGVINLGSDGGILRTGFGSPTFTNEGTIKKTAGTGTSTINMTFTNTGLIDAESGTLSLTTGTIDTGGTFKTGPGATLELANGSTFTENGTFTATGSGTLSLPEFANLSAGPNGATFNVPSSVTFAWHGGATVTVPAATTLTFNGPIAVDTTIYPTLTGGGTFLDNGTMNLVGSGALQLGWDNNHPGITTLSISALGALEFLSDGTAIHAPNGDATHSTQVLNAGTIAKSGGTGTSALDVALLSNSGTIGVFSGTLSVSAGSSQSPFTFTNSGHLNIAPGCRLQVQNDFTQTASGTLNPVLGSATSFGQLQVSGTSTLGGTLAVGITTQFTPSVGQSFVVLTANALSGVFPTTVGTGFGNGVQLNPIYSATRLVLSAVPKPITISGTVFLDINDNGVQDPGEPGLPGQIIFSSGSSGVVTDANGHYQITVQAAGTYTLNQMTLGGLLFALPAGGIYQVTVTNGQSVTGFDFADVPTSITVPLTLPPMTPFPRQGNANADYVEALYRAILNRNADQAGLQAWTSELTSGALSRLQVVEGIRQSVEHFQQEVTAFYLTFLHRQPDPAGLNAWVQQLQNGVPDEQLAFDFLDSAEYLGKGDFYFVSQMYLALLGRTPDHTGEVNWLAALGDDANGNHVGPATVTHEQVITAFLRSQESLTRLVEGYYQVYLQRLADPAGLNAWLTVLEQGGSFLTIGQQFLASDEFYSQAAAHG